MNLLRQWMCAARWGVVKVGGNRIGAKLSPKNCWLGMDFRSTAENCDKTVHTIGVCGFWLA